MNNQIKEDMKSILDNRPELVKEVNKVAEVAGYLWQKGWAERTEVISPSISPSM